jgi:putative PIN family toxin of toxin-antitoxin system
MKTAVIDTGVFVAGVFWRHEAHLCLKAWLQGILLPVVSEEILAEYEELLERVKQEQHFQTDTETWLDALRTSALWVTPVALEQKVCRDPKDNKIIGAALAAGARTVRPPETTLMDQFFSSAHHDIHLTSTQ